MTNILNHCDLINRLSYIKPRGNVTMTHAQLQTLIDSAMDLMTPAEQAELIALADDLIDCIKHKHPNIKCSRANALELFYRWGLHDAVEKLPAKERGRVKAELKAQG